MASQAKKPPKCFGQVSLITDSGQCAHCDYFGQCMRIIKAEIESTTTKRHVSALEFPLPDYN